MQVFKISGKFEQNGAWSNRDADFVGYFIKRQGDDVIEGYMEEQFPTPFDPIRYIKGLYINGCQLAFLKMCNDRGLQPLVYDFPNLNEQGFWSGFSYHGGFFANGSYEGHATVQLQEITDEDEKMELAREISAVFKEKTARANQMNRDLMGDVKSLVDFLDENSEWYPHD